MDSGYLEAEERLNSLTHGFGVLASAVAAVFLGWLATEEGDPWKLAGIAIFGTTLILLYTASTLYHIVPVGPLKARLKILDHACIYLLIAGTWTPFMLGPLRGAWGWSLMAVNWTLAGAGVVFKLRYAHRFQGVSTALYVGMGWLGLVAIGPMARILPTAALAWLLVGGIAYTAGALLYVDRQVPYSHSIWHLFVLAGSGCHAISVALL